MEALGSSVLEHDHIRFLKPFGFTDYVHLQMHARCTLSDSGTISEESSILSFPAISLRQSMERPEAQDTGSIILTGLDPGTVLNAVDLVIREHNAGVPREVPADYQITNTSWRVLKLLAGNAGLSNRWHGIEGLSGREEQTKQIKNCCM
ncbi:MAG: UDP-N-acetylglucosamine 2-epimerase [Bacteroidales bacterium]